MIEEKDKTCYDCISIVLRRGNKLRNEEIRVAIFSGFGQSYQNNTIAKYLSFLINEGNVLSEPTLSPGGKKCEAYWWVTTPPDDFEKLCHERLEHYPEDHVDYKKTLVMLEQRKSRKTA
jgi:hypothetical protein